MTIKQPWSLNHTKKKNDEESVKMRKINSLKNTKRLNKVAVQHTKNNHKQDNNQKPAYYLI